MMFKIYTLADGSVEDRFGNKVSSVTYVSTSTAFRRTGPGLETIEHLDPEEEMRKSDVFSAMVNSALKTPTP